MKIEHTQNPAFDSVEVTQLQEAGFDYVQTLGPDAAQVAWLGHDVGVHCEAMFCRYTVVDGEGWPVEAFTTIEPAIALALTLKEDAR